MADNFTMGNLRRLRDADVEVASDEPDVRGWTVIAQDGDELGEVEDLIVDTTAMKVRYLEVDDELGGRDNGDTYIPLQNVDLDREAKRVIVRGSAAAARALVPADFSRQFTGDNAARVTGDDAARAERAGGTANEVERMTRAEEEVRIGTRPVEAGEVRVGKHVETDRVRENVTVAREQVHVERRPVSDMRASGEIGASDQEIRVPIVEEEVVIEKRPVVKEELIVSKERVQETRPVEVETRREEFDIQDDRAASDTMRGRGER
jgi:uncharacterized protein (TIGR02271 family)